MKRLLTPVLTAALVSIMAQAQISTFPYTEGFEGNGGAMPAGWTLQQVSAPAGGTPKTWEIAAANDYMFSPSTVHGGSYKAAMATDYIGGSVARLISPVFDLSGIANPQLKFWHTQPMFVGVHILKIYYRASEGSEWTLLQTYDTDTPDWTQETLALPAQSATYQIAFEGHDQVGFGLQLDDIKVAAAPTGPVIGENATSLNMGTVYNNLPFGGYSKEYTVKNAGATDLVITATGSQTSADITVDGLPLTVAAGESAPLTVTLNNTNTMAAGFFNGKLVLVSNDADTPEFAIDVTASVSMAEISAYTNENFGTQFGQSPASWTFPDGGFLPSTSEGIGSSPCIHAYLSTQTPKSIQTGYISMGASPELSFNYKVLQQPAGAFDHIMPVAADAFTYKVSISKDNGKTWHQLVLTPERHGAATGFSQVHADAGAYAGEICLVRFDFATHAQLNNPKLFIDDVIIGTAPANDLAASAIKGTATPIANVPAAYTVTVTNNGSAPQSDYTVRLMKQGFPAVELGSLPGVAIAQGESHDFVFEATFDTDGPLTLYGEVSADTDEFILNNQTVMFQTAVQPATYSNVTVGQGDEEYYYLPYNTYYMQSLSQSLYFPHELGTNHGMIHSLTYQAEIKQGVVNLQNVPMQIWMGETTADNLADGWVDPSTLTLVFDGTINFPVGEYDVTVNLATPYEYKGGNLVVYSFRKKLAEDAYGNMANNFKSTTYPGSARSRANFLVDIGEFDPMNPDAIDIVRAFDFIPNTNFVFDFAGTGRLTGSINSPAGSLAQARVRIAGTGLYATTGADGTYLLPALRPGDYDIEVSCHGYFPATFQVTVTADGTVTLDATLQPIPTYTLSGKVTSADCPAGLPDAVVKLTGYQDYSTTTGANGEYTIAEVFENNAYSLSVEKKLYDTYQATVEMKSADLTHDLELAETAYPVFSAQAAIEGNDAIIRWEAPVAGTTQEYVLDDNVPESGEGVYGGYDVRMGNMYETTDEGVLKSVMVLGITNENAQGSDKTVTIEVYDADRQLLGTSTPFRLPEDAWVNVPLDNIRYRGTFYVMVRWDATPGETNWLATDNNGPNAEKMYDMAYANGEWNTMYSLFRKKCVFMIRPKSLLADESVTPAPQAYTVYRMAKGDESDMSKWSIVDETTALACVDTQWPSLADGSYRYAVTATYSGTGNHAETVFTKSVMHDKSGITETGADEKARVFPNPVVDVMNIDTDAEVTAIEIIDNNGRLLKSQHGDNRQIDLSSLATGYYIAVIHTSTATIPVKIMKL